MLGKSDMNDEATWTHRTVVVVVCLVSIAAGKDAAQSGPTTLATDEWTAANAATTAQGGVLSGMAKPDVVWKSDVLTPRERKLAGGCLIRNIVANGESAFIVSGGPLPQPIRGISAQDCIVALRLSDGQRMWLFEAGDLRGSAAAVDGNTLFVTSDGTARAIDCRRGKWIWEQSKITASRRNSSDILYDTEKVYVSMWGGRVAAMSRKDGTVQWRSTGFLSQEDENENVRPWLTRYGEKLILADAGTPAMRSLSCADGREAWTAELPSIRKIKTERIDTDVGPRTAEARGTRLKSVPTVRPCLMGPLVVLAGWYGLGADAPPYVTAIHAANGQTAWTTPLGKGTESSCSGLATDGKRVYAVLASGKLRCLEGQSGKTAWETDLLWKEHPAKGGYSSFAFVGSLAIWGDVLLVAGEPGFLNGLELATGRNLWNIELPAPLDWNGVTVARRRLLVVSGGAVMVFGN